MCTEHTILRLPNLLLISRWNKETPNFFLQLRLVPSCPSAPLCLVLLPLSLASGLPCLQLQPVTFFTSPGSCSKACYAQAKPSCQFPCRS
jgi:hypothetical protein